MISLYHPMGTIPKGVAYILLLVLLSVVILAGWLAKDYLGARGNIQQDNYSTTDRILPTTQRYFRERGSITKKEEKAHTGQIWSNQGGVERWRPLVQKYFGDKTDTALRVMACESGGNPNATSHTDDHGLMQINAPVWCGHFKVSRQDLKNPETNIRLASIIYKRSGSFRPWVCASKLGIN